MDGLIVVDLPPEEDAELCLPARAAGLDFIRLATPTTDAARLPAVALPSPSSEPRSALNAGDSSTDFSSVVVASVFRPSPTSATP